MKTLFDPRHCSTIRTRIEELTPSSPRLWGQMTSTQMLCHTADQLRIGLGELAAPPQRTPFGRFPLKQLVVYLLPWPKGAPTSTELEPRDDGGDWDTARRELLALMERFSRLGPEHAWAEHPGFGRLSGRAWGVLAYRHLDHHLRQFSV